ncbi:MAG: hypothetical protein KUG62_07045 [Rhodobacteraceae bacterium]|nr:hypothetical protein [Paracoccaceae bacterium]
MRRQTKLVRQFFKLALIVLASAQLNFATAGSAAAELTRVLWWSASVIEAKVQPEDREKLARFLNDYDGGKVYSAVFRHSQRKGEFAAHMQSANYDLIIVDATTRNKHFNQKDLDAFRKFYLTSSRALMFDGTLWIRNTRYSDLTIFPGQNNNSAALLINQIEALRKAGGGLLVGTDHRQYQASANQVVQAILPGASFSGTTNPSTDGDFVGKLLLSGKETIKPVDILRHWEVIPTQGEAPVGQFTDFTGAPVTLYSLVEISDKPGRKRMRPYISSTIDPGADRTAIDSEVAVKVAPMPTRKSPPFN